MKTNAIFIKMTNPKSLSEIANTLRAKNITVLQADSTNPKKILALSGKEGQDASSEIINFFDKLGVSHLAFTKNSKANTKWNENFFNISQNLFKQYSEAPTIELMNKDITPVLDILL